MLFTLLYEFFILFNLMLIMKAKLNLAPTAVTIKVGRCLNLRLIIHNLSY